MVLKNNNDEIIVAGDPEWEQIRSYFNVFAQKINEAGGIANFTIPVSDEIIEMFRESPGYLTSQIGINPFIGNKEIYTEDEPFPTSPIEARAKGPNYKEAGGKEGLGAVYYLADEGMATDITDSKCDQILN